VPYQAVARNAAGNLLQNQAISLRFTIHQTTSGGTTQYQETQSVTTNSLGLFAVNIGSGTPVTGSFSSITWSDAQPKFIQVEIDPTGGSSYTNMGTSQMMSVPYALYAGSANAVTSSGFANPTHNIGLSATNGSATTAMRSDAAPAIDQTMTPTWTGLHTFSGGISETGTASINGSGSAATTIGNASSATSIVGNLAEINGVSYSWTGTQGAANTVLTNNGSGTLTWAAPASSWLQEPKYSGTVPSGAALTYNPTVNPGNIITYSTPGAYSFVVPSGVSYIVIDLAGGQGGESAGCNSIFTSTQNGGARVQSTVNVTPGTTLNLYVGSAGGNATASTAGAGGTNGTSGPAYGTGGAGNAPASVAKGYGGGGGASSEVWVAGTRALVAGGGGGTGWSYNYWAYNSNCVGGFSGGSGGQTGTGGGGVTANAGGGASQSAVGSAGAACNSCYGSDGSGSPLAGSAGGANGAGGAGGYDDYAGDHGGGGGGGGGWFGGGGGSLSGAGGGSSNYASATGFVPATPTYTSNYGAASTPANGYIKIEW